MENNISPVIQDALVRSAPPLTVVGISLETCLSNTVYAITAVYVILQIVVIIPKVLNVLRKANGKGSS